KLRRILMPIEYTLSELKSVVIRDSAVDALCHGAQLAIPGILEISYGIAKGDLVGIYTQKGEVVALAEAILSESEILENTKGFAFQLKRIIMAPNTYPKNWRTKAVVNN
ncbi:MAG TPA: PUA domain-containing protein, partial [Nitrosopumilaceae archaeon]|nr:PUA domain-containing protein [Nitrosopumilaceae archaeon]